MNKPILCVDFDGVIHSYTSGWKGAAVVPDPPVEGALKFLEAATKLFEVHIFSSRSHQPGGIEAMQEWLWRQMPGPVWILPVWILGIKWPNEKPAAMVSLDDRAITFTGIFPDVNDLINFKPWNKKDV